MPGATAVTTPVELMVATDEALLLHEPPVVVVLNVAVEPAHNDVTPVMAAGRLITVTVTIARQPLLSV